MSSKDTNNYYDNNEYNNNNYNLYNNLNYNNNNNNYNQYNNNNYSNYNNNYNYNNYNNYNYNNYNNNNQYGNVIQYYNNYPVYATIPATGFTSNSNTTTNPVIENQNTYEKKDSELKGKTALKRPEVPKGIMLKIKPQDICHARPPEYSPGFVCQKMGVPAYARQSSNA